MPRPLPLLVTIAALAGCKPWITRDEHVENMRVPPHLIAPDLPGAIAECEGVPGATAYFVGEWDLYDDHTLIGIDQIAYFVNDAWRDDGGEDCWHSFDVDGTWFRPPDTVDVWRGWSAEWSTCSLDDLFVADEEARSFLLYQDEDDASAYLLVNADTGELYTEATLTEGVLRYVVGPFCVSRLGTR